MKKVFKIIILVYLLISCVNTNELKQIDIQEMFLINEKRYLVCFYSSTCRACLDTLELLNKRYQNKKYIGFLVKTDDLDCFFEEEKTTNLKVVEYQDIIISALPYLVFIEEGMIIKELFGYSEIHKENLYIFFE